ncbi:MAG: flagellar basal-body rod protein FlgF [Calditrichaeota bacterium]|nr:MAG: flagellar basal-body rod protein FlgF [Calditrichota bacterium]
MLDRLEMAAQSMVTRMAELDAVANNLANISTKGFKRETLFLNELQRKLAGKGAAGTSAGTHVPELGAVIDFSQGPMVGTGQPLDVAISGPGLFVVETPQGEAYTRDGRFTINADGILTTLDGLPVLGQGGPIELNLQQNSVSQLVINDTGEVVLDGNVVDRLKIVAVEAPEDFRRVGGNLFEPADPTKTPNEAEGVTVRQGFLEDSNVNPVEEMTMMIEILHAFRTSEKMIQAQDTLLGRAVNDIGRAR